MIAFCLQLGPNRAPSPRATPYCSPRDRVANRRACDSTPALSYVP
jgi:hypothetical protein